MFGKSITSGSVGSIPSMTTSELSDALNPYATSRQRQNVQEYSPTAQHLSYRPVVQPPQQHVPHVSELQMAMSQPAPTPQPPLW